jgi:hypothetical protein
MITACGSQRVRYKDISGSYYSQGKNHGFRYQYLLTLNKDSTFSFSIKSQDANPNCNGEWEITNNKFIILKCEEASFLKTISNGYMDGEYEIIIVNQNKLKYQDIKLRRTNKPSVKLDM